VQELSRGPLVPCEAPDLPGKAFVLAGSHRPLPRYEQLGLTGAPPGANEPADQLCLADCRERDSLTDLVGQNLKTASTAEAVSHAESWFTGRPPGAHPSRARAGSARPSSRRAPWPVAPARCRSVRRNRGMSPPGRGQLDLEHLAAEAGHAN